MDVELGDANADDYDALVLPGGVINPDKLRTIPEAVSFVRAFFEAGKPVGAICHGPWMLVEANVVRGRQRDVVAVAADGSQKCGWQLVQ